MRARTCIASRSLDPTPRYTWHIAAGPADEAYTAVPVLCGGGVVFPGGREVREPTCEQCIAIIRHFGSVKAAIAAGALKED